MGTAWPVDDIAARLFATILYGSLIGVDVAPDEQAVAAEHQGAGSLKPLPMHLAMLRRQAGRRAHPRRPRHLGRLPALRQPVLSHPLEVGPVLTTCLTGAGTLL